MPDFDYAQIVWNYLRLEHPLQPADIILGLGSHDLRTADWCAQLYRDGYAPQIVFAGATGRLTRESFTQTEAEVYAQRAIELGVPADHIIQESRSTNTGENILYTHELLQSHGIQPKSIILVTKPYMLRRAYATFKKQWSGRPQPTVYCSAIPLSLAEYCDTPDSFRREVNVMVSDLERIIKYPKLGYQIKQTVPAQVLEAYQQLIKLGYTTQLLSPRS